MLEVNSSDYLNKAGSHNRKDTALNRIPVEFLSKEHYNQQEVTN